MAPDGTYEARVFILIFEATVMSVTIVEYTAPHVRMYKMMPISIFLWVISIDAYRASEPLSMINCLRVCFSSSPVCHYA